jgi:hypothetical protein
MLRGLQSCASWTTTIYMFWDPYSILVGQPDRQLQSKTNWRHISTEQPDWMKWSLGMGFSGLWSPLFVLAFPFLGCWLFLIKFGTNLSDGPVQICWVQKSNTQVSPRSDMVSNLVQRQLAPTGLLMGMVPKLVRRPTEGNIFPQGHTTTSIQCSNCSHSFATDTLLTWSQCSPSSLIPTNTKSNPILTLGILTFERYQILQGKMWWKFNMVNFRVQTGLWRCKFACKKFSFLSLWCLSLHSTLSTPHIDFGRMQSWASKFQCQKVNSENNIGYQGEHIGDDS